MHHCILSWVSGTIIKRLKDTSRKWKDASLACDHECITSFSRQFMWAYKCDTFAQILTGFGLINASHYQSKSFMATLTIGTCFSLHEENAPSVHCLMRGWIRCSIVEIHGFSTWLLKFDASKGIKVEDKHLQLQIRYIHVVENCEAPVVPTSQVRTRH